ncbi:MAG: glycosyltransferase family 2 protein [Candidatus Kapaibacterium sp.]
MPVDIVIIHRNTYEVTSACIDSIVACSLGGTVRVVVVDNASDDGSADRLRSAYPSVTVLHAETNLGYAKACNFGAKHSQSELVVFSNSDVRYTHDALERLVQVLRHDASIAVCGPQQFFPDGTWQRSHDRFPGVLLALRNLSGLTALERLWATRSIRLSSPGTRSVTPVPYLDGAVLVVRRSWFDRIGGFDERFFFFCEDMALCHAFHAAGAKVVFVPHAHVIHERGFTRRRRLEDDLRYLAFNERARAVFLRLHAGPVTTRSTLIITTMYYAAIAVAMTLRLVVARGQVREALIHKRTVVMHLITVCADELEK